jgi:hypothetical protein
LLHALEASALRQGRGGKEQQRQEGVGQTSWSAPVPLDPLSS